MDYIKNICSANEAIPREWNSNPQSGNIYWQEKGIIPRKESYSENIKNSYRPLRKGTQYSEEKWARNLKILHKIGYPNVQYLKIWSIPLVIREM